MIGLVNANSLRLPLAAASVHMIACSPPYWGLRDYKVDGQLGQEELHDCLAWARGERPCGTCYVCAIRAIAAEAWRVLRDDGMLWLNLGDSYASPGKGGKWDADRNKFSPKQTTPGYMYAQQSNRGDTPGLKEKDMVMIPARVALALQADGWYLRSDIIWSKCLSGGARVYARTQKGDMTMTIKDMVRLDPATVKLWNGKKWSQAVAWHETPRPDNPIEITLRSGERIGCTPDHRWPTQRGIIHAKDLRIGDVIRTTTLPQPDSPTSPDFIPDEAGWFAGLYLAEGSKGKGGRVIQIASHKDEQERYERLCRLAQSYGGTCQMHQTGGNGVTINLHGHLLTGIIDTYISGRDAKTKHLSANCWQRSNHFLQSLLHGYLSGDGYWDERNKRWRLGFARNYNLEADLRTLCARLGLQLCLKPSTATYQGGASPSFRGEIRFEPSNHHNVRDDGEVVAIGKSRARKFWDITVEDNPHLFALASGVLTHNSNPMPESVNGWRWERHRVKRTNSRRAAVGSAHARAQDGVNNPQSERDGVNFADQSSRFVSCPGCDKCRDNGGYVLRRGSWRPTKAHEYIFLLAKSDNYYCDKYAVQEPLAESSIERISQATFDQQTGGEKDCANGVNPNCSARQALVNLKNVAFGGGNPDNYGRTTYSGNQWKPDITQGRNKWTVWDVPTKGYKGAHFAVWPPDLVEPMIKAGSSERGVCSHCGAPWARVVTKGAPEMRADNPNAVRPYAAASETQGAAESSTTLHMKRSVTTDDWRPTCDCPEHDPVPALVLDIFAGSGTTLEVARRLGRNAIGIDLSHAYLSQQARTRLQLDALAAHEMGAGIVDDNDYSDLWSSQ